MREPAAQKHRELDNKIQQWGKYGAVAFCLNSISKALMGTNPEGLVAGMPYAIGLLTGTSMRREYDSPTKTEYFASLDGVDLRAAAVAFGVAGAGYAINGAFPGPVGEAVQLFSNRLAVGLALGATVIPRGVQAYTTVFPSTQVYAAEPVAVPIHAINVMPENRTH